MEGTILVEDKYLVKILHAAGEKATTRTWLKSAESAQWLNIKGESLNMGKLTEWCRYISTGGILTVLFEYNVDCPHPGTVLFKRK